MFTGIITAVGKVRASRRAGSGLYLEVECAYPKLDLGESIAVDGVCLTVTKVLPGAFAADVSAESLSRTTLGERVTGDPVNLERALAVGERLGGHIVSGHVDGVGKIAAREPSGESERVTFEAPPAVLRYLAEKGSVAVDGVSLTVNAVSTTSFEVMLVPFTLGATTLGAKRPGARVNLEADVLSRYVARALEWRESARSSGGVTMELLERAGFTRR